MVEKTDLLRSNVYEWKNTVVVVARLDTCQNHMIYLNSVTGSIDSRNGTKQNANLEPFD